MSAALDHANDLQALLSIRRIVQQREQAQRFYRWKPYPKQRQFIAQGLTFRERLFMAGNQLGKSDTGAYETTMHATGLYPDDWPGVRFNAPINAWAASDTAETTRDNPQRKLVGPPEDESLFGTGMIPKKLLLSWRPGNGAVGLLDHIRVRHVSGGVSIIGFKYYSQGRRKWQGRTLDWLWCDEEPPEDVYIEGLTRTNNGQNGGRAIITATPLLGMSQVVLMFLDEEKAKKMREGIA